MDLLRWPAVAQLKNLTVKAEISELAPLQQRDDGKAGLGKRSQKPKVKAKVNIIFCPLHTS